MTEQWLVDAYNRFMAKQKAVQEMDASRAACTSRHDAGQAGMA